MGTRLGRRARWTCAGRGMAGRAPPRAPRRLVDPDRRGALTAASYEARERARGGPRGPTGRRARARPRAGAGAGDAARPRAPTSAATVQRGHPGGPRRVRSAQRPEAAATRCRRCRAPCAARRAPAARRTRARHAGVPRRTLRRSHSLARERRRGRGLPATPLGRGLRARSAAEAAGGGTRRRARRRRCSRLSASPSSSAASSPQRARTGDPHSASASPSCRDFGALLHLRTVAPAPSGMPVPTDACSRSVPSAMPASSTLRSTSASSAAPGDGADPALLRAASGARLRHRLARRCARRRPCRRNMARARLVGRRLARCRDRGRGRSSRSAQRSPRASVRRSSSRSHVLPAQRLGMGVDAMRTAAGSPPAQRWVARRGRARPARSTRPQAGGRCWSRTARSRQRRSR